MMDQGEAPTEKNKNNGMTVCDARSPRKGEDRVQLRKSIGLLSSITIIVGSVIGSGIFISPGGIVKRMQSFGASIIIWVLCGIYSLLGAYCYAELGTMLPRSGADYAYVLEAFGPFFGFLRLWIEVMVARPTSAAVIAIVFAKYTLHPFFQTCDGPQIAFTLVAIVCVLTIGLINSLSVRLSTCIQDVFTVAKVLALFIIIVTGLIRIGQGHNEPFEDAFVGSDWSATSITIAFYNGLLAYGGWNYLNCMIEEMQNPRHHLRIAIVFSCILITAIYTMANVAYVTVLSIHEILESPAVAVDFAVRIYGKAWVIMPIFVAFSTFGGVNGTILTTSRIFVVASQENQMPKLLSMLQMKQLTPIPSILFTCIITIVYVLLGSIDSLITYLGFVQWLAIGLSVSVVVVFRFTRPKLERPVRVPIQLPLVYLIVTVALLAYSFVASPKEALMGVLIIATGIPVYIIGCVWKNKPKSFNRLMGNVTRGAQKIFLLEPGC